MHFLVEMHQPGEIVLVTARVARIRHRLVFLHPAQLAIPSGIGGIEKMFLQRLVGGKVSPTCIASEVVLRILVLGQLFFRQKYPRTRIADDIEIFPHLGHVVTAQNSLVHFVDRVNFLVTEQGLMRRIFLIALCAL